MDKDINYQAFLDVTFQSIVQRRHISSKNVKSIISQREEIYVVVATPKSGSTFLSNVLSKTRKLPYIPLCYAYGSNEHDLYFPSLVAASKTGAVSQLHMKATPDNVNLLNFFSLRPIILTRNLFDSIESLARDIEKKLSAGDLGTGIHGYSFVWLTEDISNLDFEGIVDYIIDFALPWYVNFYTSWQSFSSKKIINPYFVRYENLMSHKEDTIKEIIKNIGFVADQKIPKEILDRNYLSNTKSISTGSGVSGMGKKNLSKRQLDKINRLLNYYKSFDFSNWLD